MRVAANQGVYAAECTTLSLADHGLQELCGFERFHNLSVLVLSRNKVSILCQTFLVGLKRFMVNIDTMQLTKIDHLDSNFRIRVLIAQSNRICTLKGSLQHMKFLQELDLSNNELRNLQKIKKSLERFAHLETLNLMGATLTVPCFQ